jgi:Zn-dependent M28 family amino/carboxypeptidase
MRKSLLALSLIGLLTLSVLPGRKVLAHPQTGSDAGRLVQRIKTNSALVEGLRELCDQVGGRPTGSTACAQAVQWAAQKFRDAKVDSVKTESFTVDSNLWLGGTTSAECLAPARFPVRLAAAPGSPSTPGRRPMTGRLVDAGDGTDEAFAQLGAKARGAIALVQSTQMKTLDDLFGEYFRNGPLVAAAKKAGVAALLLQSTRPRGLLYRHPLNFDGRIMPIPAAIVSREHAARLARLADRGTVQFQFTLINRTGGPYRSDNVVAEIRGRERPNEIVLIGAHLDSWDLGTGANDNGFNAALVIDLARQIKASALVPRRPIRFVLFTGEEQGMWGSAGYVQSHRAELDQHKAVVIYDIGSGRTTGFFLNGREELRGPVTAALSAVSDLGPLEHPLDGIDGTDNFDYLLSGVPNLVANQDAAPYLPDYHAESDTFDMVDQKEAVRNEAIAAALIWGLSEDTTAPFARQTRPQVEELLRATKLDEQMKAFDQWGPWTAGKRGVNKQ